MSGQTTSTLKGYNAEAAVPKYRIVKPGAADGGVILAAAATDTPVGVSWNLDAASGSVADIVVEGQAKVEYGGTVVRGAALASDGTGRAISTTTAGNRIIGFALRSGVVGDIGLTSVAPSVL